MESSDQEVFKAQIRNYRKEIIKMSSEKEVTGAVMMGVCRGKLSEGIDFSDEAARCVIVFGIPYPNFTDVRVVIKRQYLDERHKKDGKMISGAKWY